MSAGALPRDPNPPAPDLSDRVPNPDNPWGDSFPDQRPTSEDVGSIFDAYLGQEMTPELLQRLAYDLMKFDLMNQMGEAEYKQDYLDYLNRQMDLSGDELALAEKQLEFKEGPYWDWYTGPYMDSVIQQNENQLAISDNQVRQSELGIEQAQEYTKQAKHNTNSALYNALSGYYNAERARLDTSRQMAQDPRGMRVSGQTPSFGNAGY